MSKTYTQIIRNQLGVTVSALALAAAFGAPAAAQTYQTTTGFQTVTIDTAFAAQYKIFEITNGTKGWIVPSWAQQTWAVGQNTAITLSSPGGASNISTLKPCANGSLAYSSSSCLGGAPLIQVDKGGTLVLGGQQTNSSIVGGYGFENAIHADGDVDIQYAGPPQSWGTPTQQIIGINSFLGNITMEQNATATFGLSWAKGFTTFGPNTSMTLATGSVLDLWQDSGPTSTLVMGGAVGGTGTLKLDSGTLVINGSNTAANPFTGTLTVSPAQTLVIGDATHASAVFGDPAHPTANTLAITGTTAGAPILRGLGTIDDVVANAAGTVQPGYGGTLGTLTVAAYTQNATGMLKVEVNPTTNSALHVLGNATLGGTLNVTVDPGSYSTKIYNVVQVDGTMTGGFTSITTSSSVAGAIAAVTKGTNGYQVVTEVVQGAAATAPIVNGHLVSANRLSNTYFVSSLYDQVAVDSPRNAEQIGRNKYVWIEGFGRHSSVSRNDIGYHTTTEGVTAGAEYRTEANTTVGLAASYSSETLRAKGASTADIDTWHVAAYGGTNLQYMRIDGVLFYNGYDTATKRDFGATGVAQTSPGGYAYGGSAQVSLPLFRGLVTPYLRGIASRQHLDASVETGATLLDLRYNATNANTFVGDFGLRIDPLRSTPESKTKVLVTVAVEHDFSKLGENVTGLFPVDAGQTWNSYWRGDSENTAILALDVARKVTDKIEITGHVNGRASLYQTSGEISLGARYRF
ncbi:MAG: autotransporter domain-containing protein [Rhizomicrobium sp.]|nr:autotransporter domain-containing protein [Rhizomicrobium sp.]